MQSLSQWLLEAANKKHPGVGITIQPGGEIKHTAMFSVEIIKKEFSFFLDLEEQTESLKNRVNKLRGEISKLKTAHEHMRRKLS